MSVTDWLDQLPATWRTKRLKLAVTLQTERVSASSADVEYLGLENVEPWTGRLIESNRLGEDFSEHAQTDGMAGIFRPDDLLFGKLRPYLAKTFVPKHTGVCSTEFLVLRPGSEIDRRFLFYAFLCPRFIALVDSSTFGAKMPRANWDFIGGIPIPLPDILTQRRIADYLDAETGRIDALVVEKERMLALLEEKRAALISRAVTRGLDPDAPLKPSGLDWLGDIPAHWAVARAKQLFRVRDERSQTGDEELLTVSHITGVTPRSEKDVYMFKAEDMTGYKTCQSGDLVVNTLWAWMGAMGVASLPGIVSPDYHVYEPIGGVKPEFVEILCRSKPFMAEVVSNSRGVWSSRLRLYPEAFLDMRLPVPPDEEQDTIVESLARERARAGEIEKALRESITLIKERRSALITAAVTGQIELEAMRA